MGCGVCGHMEKAIIDRFLLLPPGTPGKRGPRSLAAVFGLDRKIIARHEKRCLTDDRRERVLAGMGLAEGGAPRGGGR